MLIVVGLSALDSGFSFSKIRAHYEDTLAQEIELSGPGLGVGCPRFFDKGQTREMDAFT